jgi:MFS superfamily sulfate permease-like transporter
LLANLPSVVLASIVLVAVRGLIDMKALRHLWRVSRLEFQISMVALVGVLLFGILKGVLVAAIVSILLLLAGAARPHIAFLGRIPGTRRYSDLERHPDNEVLPGMVIFRVESSLLYFNADYVHQIVWNKIQATPELRLVVCDLSDAPRVDVAGARMLSGFHRDLAKRDIKFRIVEAHSHVRDLLRAEGLQEQVGYLGRHMSVEQAITEFQTGSTPTVAVSPNPETPAPVIS